jgi:hypothetical protein
MLSNKALPSFSHAMNQDRYLWFTVGDNFFLHVLPQTYFFFWLQSTTPPEMPQGVAPNPPVPVVRAAILSRVRIKIQVSFFSARSFFDSLFFFCVA